MWINFSLWEVTPSCWSVTPLSSGLLSTQWTTDSFNITNYRFWLTLTPCSMKIRCFFNPQDVTPDHTMTYACFCPWRVMRSPVGIFPMFSLRTRLLCGFWITWIVNNFLSVRKMIGSVHHMPNFKHESVVCFVKKANILNKWWSILINMFMLFIWATFNTICWILTYLWHSHFFYT